ncbi:hypothetical protein [Roseovarius aestuarii]|uniref:Uncharacterized protein n=1 Tax=Roseovarius aestuarii TaxID=475083 RepID=A0A1X7BTA6_9RHOB|nr:hypothetical protein [Roseovarius aestuarii]SMC12838.1 hypothetical protein ROA7745_02670 [Roseovarius aestuarii]
MLEDVHFAYKFQSGNGNFVRKPPEQQGKTEGLFFQLLVVGTVAANGSKVTIQADKTG